MRGDLVTLNGAIEENLAGAVCWLDGDHEYRNSLHDMIYCYLIGRKSLDSHKKCSPVRLCLHSGQNHCLSTKPFGTVYDITNLLVVL